MPDHFEGNEVDLAELIVEIVALALDLYPRGRRRRSLDDLGRRSSTIRQKSPFASLKTLLDPDDKG